MQKGMQQMQEAGQKLQQENVQLKAGVEKAHIQAQADQQQQRLIRPFASSIGHNHGLFDEL